MARFVEITTPMPTLEEVGDSLGLSKKRRQAIIELFRKDANHDGAFRVRRGSSGQFAQKKASGSVKATVKK